MNIINCGVLAADSDWQLVGIETNGEFIPADPENGGVDTFVTGSPNPPDPPPTDH